MREQKRAKIDKMVPFTIVLLDRQAADSVGQPLGLPVALGSKTTGFALVRRTEQRPLVTAQGFPRENKNGPKARRPREKEIPGLRTGALVEAVIPEGKCQG
ncbi:MAG: RRXRR domain-containing protein [Deltaproteobacteria bacterium]|nr:RRXRR domain-containing protein [Deltaproteobacteria bacterium]